MILSSFLLTVTFCYTAIACPPGTGWIGKIRIMDSKNYSFWLKKGEKTESGKTGRVGKKILGKK